MSQTLPVIPTELPTGFCPATYQEMLNGFSSHQFVTLEDSAAGGISVSTAKPTDQSRPWLKLDQFGRPERIYVFAQGAWLSLHTLVPGLTQWWFDTVPDFTTFDGGDANPLSTLSGPMWQLAKRPNGTVIAAQFPITVGTLLSGLALAAGDVGGEEDHLLTTDELAQHSHGMTTFGKASASGNNTTTAQGLVGYAVGTAGAIDNTTDATPTVAGAAHNNMPPYVVGYLLQRTSRLYYAAP